MQMSRRGANVLAHREIAANDQAPRSEQADAGAGAQDQAAPHANASSCRDHLYTANLADTALELIKSHRLPADPPSFEVWYTYAGRFIPALNQSLNEVLKRDQPLTADEVEQIY